MYYFSQQTIIDAIEVLKNTIPSKFIGLLSILRGINTTKVDTNQTYVILDSFIGDWLNYTMLLEDTEAVESGPSLYVRFANGWSDYVSESMFSVNPQLYALIVFIYKFKGFTERPTYETLFAQFVKEFHLSVDDIDNWFDKGVFQMEFSEDCVKRSELKDTLRLKNSTLTFDGGYSVKAKASELTRAPFIQTLYAGMDGMKCLLISRTDLEYLYPSEITTYHQNAEILHSRQLIYYGAPGTGKSYKIKERLDGVPKENIFRTTFHPDSDYSTFVGAYKPTRTRKPMYGLNGGLTVRMRDNGAELSEETITYRFVPQAFLNAYVQAYRKPEEKVYLIIEEINRGNCAQIFGDLFQLLDRDCNGVSEYSIKADADLKSFLEEELGKDNAGIREGELCLPSNLYIYATMNTSDQSLFPIDSAFKRRWDWEYEPIKYKNTNWVINIQGNKYSWVSFQREINKRILEATNAEDKMLGDYFVNPYDGVITDKMLLNKILFYLWNDVCKDGEGDIFRTGEENTVSFSDLYGEKGTDTLLSMMKYLGVSLLSEYVEEDSDEYEENHDDEARYSINGEEKDEKGKAWGKRALVKRAVEIYCQNNPSLSAEEVSANWKKEGFKIPHIVETDEDRERRIAKANDPRAEKRSIGIKLSNGDSLHVSTQVGDGEKRKEFSDFLSKIQSKIEWGIKIQEL